jgi:hypothetical protein
LNEAIINTAPVIVLLLGPDGRVLRFNPFMKRRQKLDPPDGTRLAHFATQRVLEHDKTG